MDTEEGLAVGADRWAEWMREVLADRELSDEAKRRKIADSLGR